MKRKQWAKIRNLIIIFTLRKSLIVGLIFIHASKSIPFAATFTILMVRIVLKFFATIHMNDETTFRHVQHLFAMTTRKIFLEFRVVIYFNPLHRRILVIMTSMESLDVVFHLV